MWYKYHMGKEHCNKPTDRDRSILKGNTQTGYNLETVGMTTATEEKPYAFWASDASLEKAGIGEESMNPGIEEILELIALETDPTNPQDSIDAVVDLIYFIGVGKMKLINDGVDALPENPKDPWAKA
jgi:hypothetical protein